MPSSPDVIVIGAGVAGLAAATALAGAGARVLVVEARGGLGGRVSSFVDRETSTLIDNGQHVVLGCYRETFAYLDRIGAREGVELQDRLHVPVVDASGTRSALRCPDWPSPWHLVGGVARWQGLGWRDRLAVIRLGPGLLTARRVAAGRAPMPAAFEVETVRQWLHRHGQTRRLCDLLWEPLGVAALNQPIDISAAAPFVRVLGGVFGPDRRDAAIGLPVKPLSAVFGEPARAYLERQRSFVQLHAPARLVVEGGHVRGVEVRGARVSCSAVIAAVPWSAWRTLIGAEEARAAGLAALRDAAMARQPSPIVTVNLWPSAPVLDTPFVGLAGRTFQWVFEKRVPAADGEGAGGVHLSCVSSGAEAVAREPDDVLIARAWQELRDALPAARRASVLHASVVCERHATFSLAPGQPPRPSLHTPVGGLLLAGDWTDTGLPATIEGAALSGHRAAAAIAATGGAGVP